MNKLPEKQVKELKDYLTNAHRIVEELVELIENHNDYCEEHAINTETILNTLDSVLTMQKNILACYQLLDEARHADLTPYSPGQPRG